MALRFSGPQLKAELSALHKKALITVKELKCKEAELIRLLQQIDQRKAHRFCGYNSLFQYCLKALELTENQACDYIRVARKALEIPELQKDLDSGELSVSKARRIVPVADQYNYREWSLKAKSLSKRELEVELAQVNPRLNVPDHFRRVAPDVIHLQGAITEKVYEKLMRVHELLSQKQSARANGGAVKVNDVLEVSLEEFLNRHDTKEKAKRHLERTRKVKNQKEEQSVKMGAVAQHGFEESAEQQRLERRPSQKSLRNDLLKKDSHGQKMTVCLPGPGRVKPFCAGHRKPQRTPIPTQVKYKVLARDQFSCRWKLPNGQRCGETRYLEIHHKLPVHRSGRHIEDNLVTLCSGHHRAYHEGVAAKPD